MSKKDPPYTDLENLVMASVDQATDERVLPAVEALKTATNEFRAATPILNQFNKRLNTHETWLILLTVLNIANLMVTILK